MASCSNAAIQEASRFETHEDQAWLLNRTLLYPTVVSAQPFHLNAESRICLGET